LEHVRGQTLRVGVSHNPPWTDVLAAKEPQGVEADMVREIAKALDARIEWQPGGEMDLMQKLERFEIDLVIGGLTLDTPWKDRVGLTQPHTETKDAASVFATPPGENQWIVFLDREIERIKTERVREGTP
jgi:ABC-type amino acid transport substrate-binding protein